MSGTFQVVIGVIVGGVVTYLVQVLVERHKVSIEDRGALLRLAADLQILKSACDALVTSARSSENRSVAFTYVRAHWNSSPEVVPAIRTLSQFRERLAKDSRWIQVVPSKLCSMLLLLPHRLDVLLHQIGEIERELSTSEPGVRLVGDMSHEIGQVAQEDRIDELLRSTLPGIASDCSSTLAAISERVSEIRTPLLTSSNE